MNKIKRILKGVGIGFASLFGLFLILGFSGALDENEIQEQPQVQEEVVVEESSEAEIAKDIIEEESEIIVEEIPERVVEIPETKPVATQPKPVPVVTPVVPVEPETIKEDPEPIIEEKPKSSGSRYYTSTHYRAQYYYPEDCHEWKDLSPSYLRSFDSLEALLSVHRRTLSPECK